MSPGKTVHLDQANMGSSVRTELCLQSKVVGNVGSSWTRETRMMVKVGRKERRGGEGGGGRERRSKRTA